jgi:acyl-CoA synthetase (AMP-forming)/AMP-acid ligase II/aryl carrier-like protein
MHDAWLVDGLEQRAGELAEHPAFRFLVDGVADGRVQTWTFAELARRARAVATELQRRGLAGERVLAMYPPGLELVAAFFGCLYAGAVAVPVYPPDPARLARTLPRMQGIAADAGATAVLTTTEAAGMARVLTSFAPKLARLAWVPTDTLVHDEWRRPELRPETLAFLQYTSGSTAAPKGVMVTHGNLVHQQAALREAFGHRGGEVILAWLPVFHDMGLIGHVLHGVANGGTSVLMAPGAFLRRPVEWLRAIDRFGAHTSGAPDFGYALCTRKVSDAELRGLDLSRWANAYCGAEPVRPATMRAFAERFAAAGFRPRALMPCYGLAECTLMATSTPTGGGVREVDGRVGLGRTWLGQALAIVDPRTREVLPDGRAGEIWLRGPSVAGGYWGRPEATAETFAAQAADGSGPWLRTGDIGAIAGGELQVVGRIKDLVIVRGRNLPAEDVELAVEACHPAIRPSGCVVFGLEVAGQEEVVVVCEVEGRIDPDTLAQAVRGAVAAGFDAPVHAVVLLGRGGLPKTSSGKRQRSLARQAFVDGTLGERARVMFAVSEGDDPSSDAGPVPTTLPEMEAWLATQVAAVLGCEADALPRDVAFESLGLDSVRAVELASGLDAQLQRPLHASVLYTVPTIAALAAWLVEGGHGVDRAGAPDVLYPELARHLGRLERRVPERYRFDLEADVPWDRADEPGIYVPPAMLRALGMDPAPLEAEPEAWAMLQAAAASTLCAAFEVAEVTITLFVDTRRSMLGNTRSLELFREEEAKHVALFRRYAEVIARRHPEHVVGLDWDPAWGVGFWELFRAPDLFPNERVFHYLFWFFFTAFEEHSIYLADHLAAATGVQPAWKAVHLAHRREELQHVATDHAYISALELPAAERDAWSEVCVAWLCQHFDTFFAFGPARRRVAERFPRLAPHLRTGGFASSPFLQDLLESPAFRRTRLACPYLRELGALPLAARPSDHELAGRLPEVWMRRRAVLAPDPVAGP